MTQGAIPRSGFGDPIIPDIGELNELAVNGLERMFDAEKQMFCFRLRRHGPRVVREGYSRRYTIMSLLGLVQAGAQGLRSRVDVEKALGALLQQTTWINNLGDVGLLVWLCALTVPERLKGICSRLQLDHAFAFPASAEGRTMELAWFLTGLSHATLAQPGMRPEMWDMAKRSYHLLKQCQGDHGIFGHMATRKTLAGVLRGSIGSFADQVYPIYALTRFAQAYEVHPALAIAAKCAEALCEAQGPLGQWWWHYNASSGAVVQRYPVYAVHQDGMAPMALFALGKAMNSDFSGPIYKGLAWIDGNNELKNDLRDTPAGVIWRSIYRPRGWKKYCGEIRELLRPSRSGAPADDLKILFECRPYHLGWLLYAFAGRDKELLPALHATK